MNIRSFTELVAEQDWLQPVEEATQQAVSTVMGQGGSVARRISDFLNGVWLGHPLHTVLTDVPIGAWTAAVTLDTLEEEGGNRRLRQGADSAIALGLAGAAGAALAGASDWQYTTGRARRIGIVHATLNIAATLLFGASFLLRLSRNRSAGKAVALAGYGVILASAYLGGEMAYKEKIGVNHATLQQELAHTWQKVMAYADLPENELHRVEVNGTPLVIVRRGDQVYALAATCAHLGGPLAEGKLVDGAVQCPWHGSRYDLENGKNVRGPAVYWQPCFETRVQDGQIEVRAPEVVEK